MEQKVIFNCTLYLPAEMTNKEFDLFTDNFSDLLKSWNGDYRATIKTNKKSLIKSGKVLSIKDHESK